MSREIKIIIGSKKDIPEKIKRKRKCKHERLKTLKIKNKTLCGYWECKDCGSVFDK